MKKKQIHALRKKLTLAKIPMRFIISDPKKILITPFISRVFPYTQLDYGSLVQMCDIIHEIESKEIKGNIVETGCGRGGCGVLMAKYAEQRGASREIWLLDSFQGLSEPLEKDRRGATKKPEQIRKGYLSVGEEVVREVLEIVSLKYPDRVHIVQGWFEKSIPRIKEHIGPIAVLRLDADLYEPTKYVLEQLYDQVVPEGFIVIDDYKNWIGCRRALYEFFYEHDISPYLEQYPFGRIFFRKPHEIEPPPRAALASAPDSGPDPSPASAGTRASPDQNSTA